MAGRLAARPIGFGGPGVLWFRVWGLGFLPRQVERLLSSAGGGRYLLESADFWALRELEDLSKGAFSELPGWLEAAARRASSLATSTLLVGGEDKRRLRKL
jgi:hypothetical protein